ncbi:DegT/DnrJ/EryC1/StrS family aminotransferase [Nonomuraea sp. NEAU-A123]|uniref:DegT/DnrJ/EryC1/StrS family aminotransferase n=1 Tax=Nonomuraea sp. NEAU-A123 TaxID=2839649 RepID=UPI001BE485F3|nr:DegT/DnrJ/EryC1/StrS family aminotransferase [Nonomuraea sp. NEAU-A123]MBT2227271.1 DegT/DnrJ/EryC1/StrS family aminotransferase [Nonomuraea sp. NEAU-A123]
MSALEDLMRHRIGQDCLHVPSARFGLLLALRHWFDPGDRVLIAPTNCETVLFIALAAGLEPVMAPVSWRDGNIDAPRVNWSGLSGVITTHLYGQPDQMTDLMTQCERRGLVLIDDAAHAFLTMVGGRAAGTFGQAGVFSLAKHGRAMSGGFLTTPNPGALAALAEAREALLLPGEPRDQAEAVLQPMLRETLYRTGMVRLMWHASRRLGIVKWTGHRLSPREDALRAVRGDVTAMDPWLGIDLDGWRMRPGPALARYQRSRLRVIDRERERRLAGVEALRRTPWVAAGVREAPIRPLLRVPLMVEKRDEIVAGLERLGVVPGFIYDPPLDDYLPMIPQGPTPEIARWWTSHVLPVDPLDAPRMVRLLTQLGARPADGARFAKA